MHSPCKAANWQCYATQPQAVVHLSSDKSLFSPSFRLCAVRFRDFFEVCFLLSFLPSCLLACFLSLSFFLSELIHHITQFTSVFYMINLKDNLNWHRPYKICQSILNAICHSTLKVKERRKHPLVQFPHTTWQVPDCPSATLCLSAFWSLIRQPVILFNTGVYSRLCKNYIQS